MKKCPPDTLDPIDLSQTTQRTVSTRLRAPKNPDPISHVFTILPNIGTETLLSHACETLASLNVLTTDLACKLEGSHRSLALSIQQLPVVGELLVNRALDNLDPPGDASSPPRKAPNLERIRPNHGSIHSHHQHRLPDRFPTDRYGSARRRVARHGGIPNPLRDSTGGNSILG